MKRDWWPRLLAIFLRQPTETRIAVAALPSVENEPHRPGEWRGITALAPADDLAAVSALPLGLAHEVAKNGDADIMKAFILDNIKEWRPALRRHAGTGAAG